MASPPDIGEIDRAAIEAKVWKYAPFVIKEVTELNKPDDVAILVIVLRLLIYAYAAIRRLEWDRGVLDAKTRRAFERLLLPLKGYKLACMLQKRFGGRFDAHTSGSGLRPKDFRVVLATLREIICERSRRIGISITESARSTTPELVMVGRDE